MPERSTGIEVIGEMMLARSVLEEKNELLEQKEAQLGELRRRLQAGEGELAELRSGNLRLIESVVRLAGDFLPDEEDEEAEGSKPYSPDAGLAGRLIALLMKEYGVTAIDRPAGRLDPAIHEVVDVQEQADGVERIVKLKVGFRLGSRVLRPMRVRVLTGSSQA